jgi:hypothetical protein
MSRRRTTRLAWSACGLAFVLAGLAVVLAIFNGLDARTLFADFLPGLALDAIAFATLGAVIASRRPDHRIGWLLCTIGLGAGLGALGGQYARYGLITEPGMVVGAALASWWGAWWWIIGFALPVQMLLLLFPTGRVPSPRWRSATWLLVADMVVAAVIVAINPVPFSPRELPVASPLGIQAPVWSSELLRQLSLLLIAPGPALCIAALTARFRRARGVERQQLKWFIYAGVLILLGVDAGPSLLLQSVLTSDTMLYVNGVVGAIVFPCLAAAVALAILRYRLYDIDLIIRRTLVYGVLTALLALAYWGLVVVLQQVLQPLTQGSELAIVGSTLAVAALFQPLRQRVQLTVDRRFYRQRYDAAHTLAAFSARLREEIDLDALGDELVDVIGRTMQPTSFSLWLKNPNARRRRNDPGTVGH